MPPVSQAQRAAMFAAKAGHSTLGIPQSVGADFANADPGGKLPARVGASAVEQHMGLPKGGKRKVRRGGGRHKGPSAVQKHHADIGKHLAAGNHQGAKLSALHLAKALHGMTKPQGSTSGTGAPKMPSDHDGDEPGEMIAAMG